MLDHLVYATPTLESTVADLASRGVVTVPGGPHVGLGTRNHLAALGSGAYLEVIGPDPEQPTPGGPRPFGVDGLEGPALVAWCARPDRPLEEVVADLRAVGYDPGPIGDMSRRRPDGVVLSWRLTLSTTPTGALPFLIDWLDTPHPSESAGGDVLLERFTVHHPQADLVRRVIAAVGEPEGRPSVHDGPVERLAASLRLPDGTLLEL